MAAPQPTSEALQHELHLEDVLAALREGPPSRRQAATLVFREFLPELTTAQLRPLVPVLVFNRYYGSERQRWLHQDTWRAVLARLHSINGASSSSAAGAEAAPVAGEGVAVPLPSPAVATDYSRGRSLFAATPLASGGMGPGSGGSSGSLRSASPFRVPSWGGSRGGGGAHTAVAARVSGSPSAAAALESSSSPTSPPVPPPSPESVATGIRLVSECMEGPHGVVAFYCQCLAMPLAPCCSSAAEEAVMSDADRDVAAGHHRGCAAAVKEAGAYCVAELATKLDAAALAPHAAVLTEALVRHGMSCHVWAVRDAAVVALGRLFVACPDVLTLWAPAEDEGSISTARLLCCSRTSPCPHAELPWLCRLLLGLAGHDPARPVREHAAMSLGAAFPLVPGLLAAAAGWVSDVCRAAIASSSSSSSSSSGRSETDGEGAVTSAAVVQDPLTNAGALYVLREVAAVEGPTPARMLMGGGGGRGGGGTGRTPVKAPVLGTGSAASPSSGLTCLQPPRSPASELPSSPSPAASPALASGGSSSSEVPSPRGFAPASPAPPSGGASATRFTDTLLASIGEALASRPPGANLESVFRVLPDVFGITGKGSLKRHLDAFLGPLLAALRRDASSQGDRAAAWAAGDVLGYARREMGPTIFAARLTPDELELVQSSEAVPRL